MEGPTTNQLEGDRLMRVRASGFVSQATQVVDTVVEVQNYDAFQSSSEGGIQVKGRESPESEVAPIAHRHQA